MANKELVAKLSPQTAEGLQIFHSLLQGKTLSRENPVFEKVLVFLQRPGMHSLPTHEKEKLSFEVRRCFSLTESELLAHVSEIDVEAIQASVNSGPSSSAQRIEDDLWKLIPRGSFLEQYCIYTKSSEAPLAYHLFTAMVGVGLLVGRRVHLNMGHYQLYPPMAVFLLGPSGLRKTSATNIMLNLLNKLEHVTVYPEKLTPEVLAVAVQRNPQGLLFAPEMTAMLGKAKYLEGLITLITRLQDCPDFHVEETIGRGQIVLKDVAMSVLMCSTPDWFVSNTPESTFGGGFVARNIMVMQNDTPREEHIPTAPPVHLKEDILMRLTQLRGGLMGPMELPANTFKFHREWYHHHKEITKTPEHALLGTYYNRKPDHVKKLAMCLELIENYSLELKLETLETAIKLMDWIEQFIPPLLQNMFRSQMGEQAEFVLRTIKAEGGMVKHSTLVRKCQHKFNAQTLRSIIGSLKESETIAEVQNGIQHMYMIKGV